MTCVTRDTYYLTRNFHTRRERVGVTEISEKCELWMFLSEGETCEQLAVCIVGSLGEKKCAPRQ